LRVNVEWKLKKLLMIHLAMNIRNITEVIVKNEEVFSKLIYEVKERTSFTEMRNFQKIEAIS
jgi:hypothetical protein